jgi:hypothetical protein
MPNAEFLCQWLGVNGDSCHRPAVGKASLCRFHRMQKRIADAFELAEWTRSQSTGPSYFYTKQGVLNLFLAGLCLAYFQQCKFFALVFSSGSNTADNAVFNPTYAIVYLSCFTCVFGVLVARCSRADLPGWTHEHPVLAGLLLYSICFSLLRLPKAYVDNRHIQVVIDAVFIMPLAVCAIRVERKSGLASPWLVCAGLALLFVSGIVGPLSELLHRLIGGFDLFRGASDPTARQQMASLSVVVGIGFSTVAIEAAVALSTTGYLVTPFPQRGSPYYKWFQRNFRRSFLPSVLVSFLSICLLFLILYAQGQLLRYLIVPWFSVIDRIPYWDVIYLGLAVAAHYSIAKAIRRRPRNEEMAEREEDEDRDWKSELSVKPQYDSERGALDFYIQNDGDRTATNYDWHLLIPQRVLTWNVQVLDNYGVPIPADLIYTIKKVSYLHHSDVGTQPLYPNCSSRIAYLVLGRTGGSFTMPFWWKTVSEDGANPEKEGYFTGGKIKIK